VSGFDQLKDTARDYPQQHPEQVRKATQEGEEGIEHALGIEQEGNPPAPEQGEAQQGNAAKGDGTGAPGGQGEEGQQPGAAGPDSGEAAGQDREPADSGR
jgi:hypothetical protein